MSYSGGLFNDATCNLPVNHAVTAVGYGYRLRISYCFPWLVTFVSWTPYVIIKNSWGTGWGESGYIRIVVTNG